MIIRYFIQICFWTYNFIDKHEMPEFEAKQSPQTMGVIKSSGQVFPQKPLNIGYLEISPLPGSPTQQHRLQEAFKIVSKPETNRYFKAALLPIDCISG